jgi:hypothetical protein
VVKLYASFLLLLLAACLAPAFTKQPPKPIPLEYVHEYRLNLLEERIMELEYRSDFCPCQNPARANQKTGKANGANKCCLEGR